MSHQLKLGLWVGGIAVATTAAAVLLPGHREASVGAGVMTLLAVLLVETGRLAYRVSRASGSSWERVRRVPSAKIERPEDLERIERRLGWGQYSSGDFNYRVRPMLRRLAAARLRDAHGISLEEDGEKARSVASADLWDYVIAKQPPGAERVITTADIARLVDDLEEL